MTANRLNLHFVTGIDDVPVSRSVVDLQCGLPRAVVVRLDHYQSPATLVLTVSDFTATLERDSQILGDDCPSCAVRDGLFNTLMALHDAGKWQHCIVRLPLGHSATHLCRVAAMDDRLLDAVSVASVTAALEGSDVGADLVSADTLGERIEGHDSSDDVTVAETVSEFVEYADVVMTHGGCETENSAFLKALARPGTRVVTECTDTLMDTLQRCPHDHDLVEEWVDPVTGGGHEQDSLCEPSAIWTMELLSAKPFHPQRLQDTIERLGGGWFRSRGCFWLPSRPRQVLGWDSAAGCLSISTLGSWAAQPPHTRILFTGFRRLDDDATDIRQAFQESLLTDDELSDPWSFLASTVDGFEPWLGEIHLESAPKGTL